MKNKPKPKATTGTQRKIDKLVEVLRILREIYDECHIEFCEAGWPTKLEDTIGCLEVELQHMLLDQATG